MPRRLTPFPHDIGPGETITLDAVIEPLFPKGYWIVWDIVINPGSAPQWFSSDGNPSTSSCLHRRPTSRPVSAPWLAQGSTATNTPVLQASRRDRPMAFPFVYLYYQFTYCIQGSCNSSPWSTTGTFTMPAMRWNTPYEWKVDVHEGSDPVGLAGHVEPVALRSPRC